MNELRQRPVPLAGNEDDGLGEKYEFDTVKAILTRIFIKKYNNKHTRRRGMLYICSGVILFAYFIYAAFTALRCKPLETTPAYISTDENKPIYISDLTKRDTGSGDRTNYIRKYMLDKTRSDSVPLNRQLADHRPQVCKVKPYVNTRLTISIIIVLYTAPPSVILRMIFSAIERTKPENLAEIIMMAQKGAFDISSYISRYELTHIVRVVISPLKKSLSSARNEAANFATGDILVFLPEAVEILPGWAEPLLEAMHSEGSLLAGLSMDEINAETFEQVEHVPWHLISIPRWDLTTAVPIEIPEHEKYRRQLFAYPDASPVKTPVLQFIPWAADRRTFLRLGGLDEGMIGSGREVHGDLLELSIRWWNCDGEVAYLPCSKVAIISLLSDPNPQMVNDKEQRLHNSQRTARRWASSYMNDYLEATPGARTGKVSQSTRLDDIITGLSCNNLNWYISNVAVDWLFGDKVIIKGSIKTGNSNFCADNMGHDGRYNQGRPRFYKCHGGYSQTWVYRSNSKQVQTETGKCLMSDPYWHDVLTLDYCTEGHSWKWEPLSQGSKLGYLVYKDLCLEYRTENNLAFYSICKETKNQQFLFESLS